LLENPSSGSEVIPYGETKVMKLRFSQFCKRA